MTLDGEGIEGPQRSAGIVCPRDAGELGKGDGGAYAQLHSEEAVCGPHRDASVM